MIRIGRAALAAALLLLAGCGELLFRIAPATYQAAVDSALADLAKARANLLPARLKERRFRDLVAIKAVRS